MWCHLHLRLGHCALHHAQEMLPRAPNVPSGPSKWKGWSTGSEGNSPAWTSWMHRTEMDPNTEDVGQNSESRHGGDHKTSETDRTSFGKLNCGWWPPWVGTPTNGCEATTWRRCRKISACWNKIGNLVWMRERPQKEISAKVGQEHCGRMGSETTGRLVLTSEDSHWSVNHTFNASNMCWGTHLSCKPGDR